MNIQKLREYCMKQAFEEAFSNLSPLETYGCNSWTELFNRIVSDGVQKAMYDKDEDVCVWERYEFDDIVGVLEELSAGFEHAIDEWERIREAYL